MTAKFIKATNLQAFEQIRHGFFTSAGGCSRDLYSSLNCGYGSGDIHDNVRKNRRQVAMALEANAENLCTPYQIHSPTAAITSSAWVHSEAPQADAVVTNVPGLRIGILTADCCPVLFADPEAGVVGAAHAGWRGALGGVTDDTIEKMETLGAIRDRISVAIGPTISQSAYEVGPEFKDKFIHDSPENADFFTQSASEKSHFDLTGYISRRLDRFGIRKNNVELINLCTFTNESILFSYRRSIRMKQPDYGRQISAIGIK